jgi:hypothetical protein
LLVGCVSFFQEVNRRGSLELILPPTFVSQESCLGQLQTAGHVRREVTGAETGSAPSLIRPRATEQLMCDFRTWLRKVFRIDARFRHRPRLAQSHKTPLRLEPLEDRTVHFHHK